MFHRRDFLKRASLLAVGSYVPQFLANTALAAKPGKDSVLVVIELSGGNDGLNTVIPYGDDLYHKARPTLRFTKDKVIKVDDHVGLNPVMESFRPLMEKGQLGIVQGVGYPNPDRSHFEAMDIWQSADPLRKIGTGWLGRCVPSLLDKNGNIPVMQVGPKQLPLALQGAAGGVVSINNQHPFLLQLNAADPNKRYTRKKLIEDLNQSTGSSDPGAMLSFVKRRQLQTYTTLERLEEVLDYGSTPNPANQNSDGEFFPATVITPKLQLISRLIDKGLGTRVFYVALDGFDTHSNQAEEQRKLLAELATGISYFFGELQKTGHDKRVVVMTFSEFGRRVQENGSRGTDHGAGSCMFVAGPAVKGGAIGKHPSLSDLDAGDLKHHTDFRQVYATLLDQWLGCSSNAVLGGDFKHVGLLKS